MQRSATPSRDTAGVLSGVDLSLNAQDLFDADPPVVLNGTLSWDNQNVSPLGRFVSFAVTKGGEVTVYRALAAASH